MSQTAIAKPGNGHGTVPSDETPVWRRRPVIAGAGVVVILAVAAAIWLRGSGDAKVPYSDAQSAGVITLCGSDGKPVTSGSTRRAPFVSRAVGATAATGTFAGAGRTATLYAFQPRQGTESQEWSGQLLTAASDYTNTAHPMAQATKADVPLKNFLTAFPARWDGFVQLRLYLATPVNGEAATYDSVAIKVDGSSWKVVGRTGTAGCTDGRATSHETTAGVGQ